MLKPRLYSDDADERADARFPTATDLKRVTMSGIPCTLVYWNRSDWEKTSEPYRPDEAMVLKDGGFLLVVMD